jgi:hypothetical protein
MFENPRTILGFASQEWNPALALDFRIFKLTYDINNPM